MEKIKNNLDSNNLDSNNLDSNNLDSNNLDSNNLDSNNLDSNNLDSNNLDSNNLDSNNLDSNNLDTDFLEMERKKGELYKGKDNLKFHDQICDFCYILRKKFSDYNQYKLYHSLIGSTVKEKDIKKIDFPGKYSIKNFIEEKFNEM